MSRMNCDVAWEVVPTATIEGHERLVRRRRVTAADLRKLSDLSNPLSDSKPEVPLDPDLFGYAAQEAIKVLFQNWSDAQASAKTADEFSSVSVLSDIDSTIDQLRRYLKRAREVFES